MNWMWKNCFIIHILVALKPKLANHKGFGELSKQFVMVNVEDDEEPKGAQFNIDGSYVPRIFFISKWNYWLFRDEVSVIILSLNTLPTKETYIWEDLILSVLISLHFQIRVYLILPVFVFQLPKGTLRKISGTRTPNIHTLNITTTPQMNVRIHENSY